jgi:hypothetical protein
MATTITYDGGRPDLRIPDGEARRCEVYRDPGTSEVSFESYLLAEALAERPSLCAEISCNGGTLARSVEGAHWSLTPAGQSRLAWEASLLKERWRA